jgi:two-component system chemotaxis response regulator CheY
MICPTILSVGQCGFDHNRIAHQFEQSFGARVRGVSTFGEALDALRREHYDLLLVNRVSDEDGSLGIELIRRVKAAPGLADLPVMLVSNDPEAQQQAEALGACAGFGKSDLSSETTRQRVESALGPGLGSAKRVST